MSNPSPSQIANSLRRIAAGIDNSQNPDQRLVVRDLKKVLASVGGDTTSSFAKKIASQMYRFAKKSGEDFSAWELEEGKRTEDVYEHARKQKDDEDVESGLKMLKRQVDRFLKELVEGTDLDEDDDDGVETSAPKF